MLAWSRAALCSSKAERSGISREFQVAASAGCGDQSLPVARHSRGAPVQFLRVEKRRKPNAAHAFGQADLEIGLDGIGCTGLRGVPAPLWHEAHVLGRE